MREIKAVDFVVDVVVAVIVINVGVAVALLVVTGHNKFSFCQ